MKALLTFVLIGIAAFASAQSPKQKANKATVRRYTHPTESPDSIQDIKIPEGVPFTDSEGLEIQPEFLGGNKAFSKYIRKNLKWPPGLKLTGKVLVGFAVERNGNLSTVKVITPLSPLYDAEAVRVVKNSPRWIPGKRTLDGKHWKSHRVMLTLPIIFSLK